MLILTRRIGESIRIGDTVRLTIQSKLRAHLTVMLAAPASLTVTDDADVQVSPVCQRERQSDQRYIISVMPGDSLRIGEEVVVWFRSCPYRDPVGWAPGRQVRVGIDAPRALAVHREEIYQRIQRGEPFQRGEAG